MHPPRELPAVPDHVTHADGVGTEHIVRLCPRQCCHLVGGGRGGRAMELGGGGGDEVAGVDGEEECGVGDVLHVVPLPGVEHAAGRAVHVVADVAVLAQARAEVVLRLGFVPLQGRLVLRPVVPFQEQLKKKIMYTLILMFVRT